MSALSAKSSTRPKVVLPMACSVGSTKATMIMTTETASTAIDFVNANMGFAFWMGELGIVIWVGVTGFADAVVSVATEVAFSYSARAAFSA